VELPEGVTNRYMPPTLRTAEMYTVGKLLAQEINIPQEVVRQAFETFQPAENRIVTCNHKGKQLFFHGETSGGSRLISWFETLDGTKPWLFVDEVNFADEDPQGFKNLLQQVFDSEKTYVLDTPTNREKLPVNAQFVNEEKFQDLLENKASGYIVYHKALANRQQNFAPETYLNEKW
jgi:hypothetical protein